MLKDFNLMFGPGIIHQQLEHKAVNLCLRQRICAFLFNRILSRDHQKRSLQQMGFSVDADLLFLHHFQQGRLSLWGRTIDFVGQQQVCKHRPRIERKRLLLHVVNAVSGEIRRHQVGRKLDSAKLAGHRSGQHIDKQRFAKPRRPFNEHASFRKQRDDNAFDQFHLTDNDLTDLLDD